MREESKVRPDKSKVRPQKFKVRPQKTASKLSLFSPKHTHLVLCDELNVGALALRNALLVGNLEKDCKRRGIVDPANLPCYSVANAYLRLADLRSL